MHPWLGTMSFVSPRGMRRFAVVVAFIGVGAIALGIACIAADFAGSVVAALAFLSAALAAGLAAELWYVSRRIERLPETGSGS